MNLFKLILLRLKHFVSIVIEFNVFYCDGLCFWLISLTFILLLYHMLKYLGIYQIRIVNFFFFSFSLYRLRALHMGMYIILWPMCFYGFLLYFDIIYSIFQFRLFLRIWIKIEIGSIISKCTRNNWIWKLFSLHDVNSSSCHRNSLKLDFILIKLLI